MPGKGAPATRGGLSTGFGLLTFEAFADGDVASAFECIEMRAEIAVGCLHQLAQFGEVDLSARMQFAQGRHDLQALFLMDYGIRGAHDSNPTWRKYKPPAISAPPLANAIHSGSQGPL